MNGDLAGFFMRSDRGDHLYLDQFHIAPGSQGSGLGGGVLYEITSQAKAEGLPIRLDALRSSRANDFYRKHGFRFTYEKEWDIYYEFTPG